MIIRKFTASDAPIIAQLFYDTVHAINVQDYASQLIEMWAPNNDEFTRLIISCESNIFLVAQSNDTIIGFGDMDHYGYLERLFVHKDFQGQRIGTAILDALEAHARLLNLSAITTEASVRAMPFFKKHGFRILRTIHKDHPHKGLIFTTYKMKKMLTS